MTNIICRRVGFSYPGAPFPVFSDLDLTIDAGWRGALIGRNGRGKTTLLRLIHGALLPESGRIEIATPTYLFPSATPPDQISVLRAVKDAVGPFVVLERRMAALLDEQTSEATREYSDLEAKYSRNHGYQIDAWIQRELDALEVPVAQYLAAKRGFLLVSHDRHFIDQAVDHVVSLNKADVTTMRGNYSSWRANFDADQQRELARNATLKKDIKRLTGAAGQRRAGARKREGTKGPHSDTGYTGHKAAKQMQRALNIERRSEREVRERRSLLKNHDKARALKLESAPASGPPLLTATNLGLDRGGRTLFDTVSFVVMPGERLAVCGGNGTGKTSLLEVLCGNLDGYRGTVKARSQLQTSRGYQDPLWTHGDLDAHLDRSGLDRSRFRQIMAVLGVAGEVLTRPLEQLSHGQRKKVDLARSFAEPGQLLIWDEPLNYLDVESRRQITEVILQDQPTLIFVEHDRHFVEAIATSSLNLGKATTFLKTDSPRKRVRRKANGPNPRSAPFLLMGKDRFIAALF